MMPGIPWGASGPLSIIAMSLQQAQPPLASFCDGVCISVVAPDAAALAFPHIIAERPSPDFIPPHISAEAGAAKAINTRRRSSRAQSA
jgi:hypothetical protein